MMTFSALGDIEWTIIHDGRYLLAFIVSGDPSLTLKSAGCGDDS